LTGHLVPQTIDHNPPLSHIIRLQYRPNRGQELAHTHVH